jgi:hypothetical protein
VYPWSLSEALELVREIQPQIKRYGYHVALGGGVLNNGYSEKDADLYFLSLDDATTTNIGELSEFLSGYWHDMLCTPIGDVDHYGPHKLYRLRQTYRELKTGKRIDVFIV